MSLSKHDIYVVPRPRHFNTRLLLLTRTTIHCAHNRSNIANRFIVAKIAGFACISGLGLGRHDIVTQEMPNLAQAHLENENEDIDRLLLACDSALNGVDVLEPVTKRPPTKVLNAYLASANLRTIVDIVCKGLKKPTPIQIPCSVVANMNAILSGKEDWTPTGPQRLDIEATFLVAAIQILMFAPLDNTRDLVYSTDPQAYVRRYPTVEEYDYMDNESRETQVSGFSLEDLHRALAIMTFLIHARGEKNRNPFAKFKPTAQKDMVTKAFQGYIMRAWKDLSSDQEERSIALSFAEDTTFSHLKQQRLRRQRLLEAAEESKLRLYRTDPVAAESSSLQGLTIPVDEAAKCMASLMDTLNRATSLESQKRMEKFLGSIPIVYPSAMVRNKIIMSLEEGFSIQHLDELCDKMADSQPNVSQWANHQAYGRYLSASQEVDNRRAIEYGDSNAQLTDKESEQAYYLANILNGNSPGLGADFAAFMETFGLKQVEGEHRYEMYPSLPGQGVVLFPHQVAGKFSRVACPQESLVHFPRHRQPILTRVRFDTHLGEDPAKWLRPWWYHSRQRGRHRKDLHLPLHHYDQCSQRGGQYR